MKLDSVHSCINQALTDRAIKLLVEYRNLEGSNAAQEAKDRSKKAAVEALQSIMDYLTGDFSILSTEDVKRATELEEKEPQFIAVAEHNQHLVNEIHLLKSRLAKAEGGSKVDLDGVKKKTTASTKKKKSKPKKATVAKKKAKKKAAPKAKKNQCPKCGRKFKSGAGLARHKKSCKG
jgi:topoisomerase IA-like protein